MRGWGSRGLIPAIIISIRIFLLPLIYILWTAFDAREGKKLWKLNVYLPYWSILLIPGPDWLTGRREEISVRWSNNCQNYRIIHCHNCYWKHQEAHNGQNILQTFYRQYSTTPVICSSGSARSAQPSQTICNQADFRFLSASIFTLLHSFLRRLIADFLCHSDNIEMLC